MWPTIEQITFRFQPFLIALDMKGCHPHCYNKENNIVQTLLKRHGNIIEYLPVAGQRKLQISIDDMNDDPVIKCIFNKDNHHIYQSQLQTKLQFFTFLLPILFWFKMKVHGVYIKIFLK